MSNFETDSVINNRYQVLCLLGKGGMATVYKVLDKERSLELALKSLNPDQLGVARRKERFIKEFSILSRLNHDNVVKVFEQDQTESGVPFYTMECLRGAALADRLKEISTGQSPDFSGTEAILLLEEVACGLSYLHEQGVVYCDLKPANIMLPESEVSGHKLKLVDFGISRLLADGSGDGAVNMVGTSYYMSPEQIRSEDLDARSDIYSFGVLAFEILTGNVPFNQQTLFNVTASHLIGKVPSIRGLNKKMPEVIDRMIQICMEKDKDNRYSSMKDIVERLKKARLGLEKPSFFKRIFRR